MPPKEGHWPPHPKKDDPFHENHMQHFGQALEDALSDWPDRDLEGVEVKFVADFFNVFNSQKVRLPDQNKSLTFDPVLGNPPNQDFLKPVVYYLPFSMRLGLRFEF